MRSSSTQKKLGGQVTRELGSASRGRSHLPEGPPFSKFPQALQCGSLGGFHGQVLVASCMTTCPDDLGNHLGLCVCLILAPVGRVRVRPQPAQRGRQTAGIFMEKLLVFYQRLVLAIGLGMWTCVWVRGVSQGVVRRLDGVYLPQRNTRCAW